MSDRFVLASPLDGWCAPLAETPDPVFAEAMLGDGVAIDPTRGTLRAPCEAVVVSLHASRHALTLRADGGLEILLHLGLETVALHGEGFTALVKDGQPVRTGDPLILFDLDLLARRSKSLISPVVITTPAGFEIAARHVGRLVTAGEPILELVRAGAGRAAGPGVAGPELTRDIRIPLAHGLHARPAARIAEALKPFDAEVALGRAGRRVSARSAVGLMSLGLQHGDEATLYARGPDAAAALEAVAGLIASGMGEAKPFAVADIAPERPADTLREGLLRGVSASPGLAIGRATRLVRREIAAPETGRGAARERAALAAALAFVGGELNSAQAQEPNPTRRAILAAHAAFLEDPELTGEAERLIGEGRSAGFAWRAAVRGFAEALRALNDRRMAERVDDLIDLERRVLVVLSGEPDTPPAIPTGAILLAEELLPSQLMGLEPGRVAGVCTARGGPTSHVAILAASMGVPAVVAAGPGVLAVPDGATVILDGEAATLAVSPDATAIEQAQVRLARQASRRRSAQASAGETAALTDGTVVPVLANLGSAADAEAAVLAGADGSGLLRTEFLFLDRETAPDEEEQAQRYRQIAGTLEGRPLVIRLLDVGGDKAAPYLPQSDEENPALGVRGVRLLLRRPQLLKSQLRAILRANRQGQCSIMVPMVSQLAELRAVRAALEEAQAETGCEARLELGVMIETPAAAVIARQLAAEADFFSIGTNDLTQYVLAMDRGEPELAPEVDGLDPAVLGLIAQTCAGAKAGARAQWTSVCGGLAADPAAIPILLGLGVAKLSMIPAAVAEAKALVRTLSPERCRALAEQALAQPSAAAVRALAEDFLHGDA